MQENTDYYDLKNEITNSETNFGGFWIRIAAYLIDFIVIAIPVTIIEIFILGYGNYSEPQVESYRNISSYIIFAVWCIYYTSFHSSDWQATIGKRAFGLKVVDINGNRISFTRALARFFALYLSVLPLLIGIFMIGWTKYNQGLHDLIAKTYVIKSR